MVMGDFESSAPELRASDGERERAADLLREAMASGRLSVDELEERMRLVFGVKTHAELERLVDDVLVPTDDRHPILPAEPPRWYRAVGVDLAPLARTARAGSARSWVVANARAGGGSPLRARWSTC
jgi:DUF1707 SHOCT-like domain